MKSKFPGFYSTSEDSLRNIWLSDSTVFIFDTNCLLNLYRCEDNTREEILGVMRVISSRTWLPFQVGFEYQRNRRVAIEDSIISLKKIQRELENIYTQNILGGVKKQLNKSLNDDIQTLQDNLKKTIVDFIDNKISPRIKSKESISSHDFIRDDIDKIIKENVGTPPTQGSIDEIDAEGETRYSNKIPPGFSDSNKKEVTHFASIKFQKKFGDLYLWKEIINKAKSEDIENVIFITDDNKEDWWFSHSGRTHGPLEALKTEICNQSKISNFKLINQSTFLQEAKQYLNDIHVSDESLMDVEELTISNFIEDEKNGNIFKSHINSDLIDEENMKYNRIGVSVNQPLDFNDPEDYDETTIIMQNYHNLNRRSVNNISRIKMVLNNNTSHPFNEELVDCLADLQIARSKSLTIYNRLQKKRNFLFAGEYEDYLEIKYMRDALEDHCMSLVTCNEYAEILLNSKI
ncbi:PIN-like domain-containing protein [Kosakonia cowanii]|uniref:PIN-like domain-containing protein n=1 Tax=Kosakonia cowanii TaxID=208223 RepID=UPI003D993272